MAETSALKLIVRTPHSVVFEERVRSTRVPTETGQVGLRPRTEPTVLAVEVGVVYVQLSVGESNQEIYIGTAGGLLVCEVNVASLLTPLAVVGHDADAIIEQIDQLMQQPNSELEARATLSKLQGHILKELRRERQDGIAQKLEQLF